MVLGITIQAVENMTVKEVGGISSIPRDLGLANYGNCLCTWFRFDQDVAGARFGAQSLREQRQEGSVAISAPIEAKDELAETGLEALGAQPVAAAPRPALEVAERGVDPGEDFTGGPVADDRGGEAPRCSLSSRLS